MKTHLNLRYLEWLRAQQVLVASMTQSQIDSICLFAWGSVSSAPWSKAAILAHYEVAITECAAEIERREGGAV